MHAAGKTKCMSSSAVLLPLSAPSPKDLLCFLFRLDSLISTSREKRESQNQLSSAIGKNIIFGGKS